MEGFQRDLMVAWEGRGQARAGMAGGKGRGGGGAAGTKCEGFGRPSKPLSIKTENQKPPMAGLLVQPRLAGRAAPLTLPPGRRQAMGMLIKPSPVRRGRRSALATRASPGGDGAPLQPPPPPPLPSAWATTPAVAGLPIAASLPAITARLEASPVLVLEAAPGAGKTTTLPLALALDLGLRVMVVEPRRLAARAAARRMAGLLGERVGDRVGFRVRGSAAVSAATVVVVVTPGLALRALAGAAAAAAAAAAGEGGPASSHPPLARFDAILLDEIHERGVETDACLALLAAGSPLRTARPGLRVLAASATLGGGLAERVAALLDDVPSSPPSSSPPSILTLPEGRAYPVRTVYAGPPPGPRDADLAASVVAGLRAGWGAMPGDALVFLPGAREIRACVAAVGAAFPDVAILPLYGALPAAEQDAALKPPPPPPPLAGDGRGMATPPPRRRVILATPVAESSLTVPGVRLVVDSGLARSPAADAASGLERLVTGPVSQASADQRRGRAGRTAPGLCVRLWSEASHARRLAGGVPAVLRSDFAPTALVLARAGLGGGLAWLDAPPAEAVATAGRLLRWLGAVGEGGPAPAPALALTPDGAAMASLGAHPRLARMLLVAAGAGAAELGAVLAALCGAGRDVIPKGRGTGLGACLGLRVLALAGAGPGAALLDGRAARVVLDDAAVLYGQLRRAMGVLERQRQAGAEEEEDEGGYGGADTSDEEDDAEDSEQEAADASAVLTAYGRGPAARARLAAAAAAQASGGGSGADPTSPSSSSATSALVGALVAAAYPDRVAVRRGRGNRGRDAAFDLGGWADGGGGAPPAASSSASARLPDPLDALQAAPLLAVAALASSAPGRSPIILAAAGLDPGHPAVRGVPGLVTEECRAEWVRGPGGLLRLAARRLTRVGGVVADAAEVSDPGELGGAALEAAAVGLAASAGLAGAGAPPEVLAARSRAGWWVERQGGPAGGLPDLSEAALAATLPAWLPGLAAARTAADLEALPWADALARLLPEDAWAAVEAAAPAVWEAAPGVALPLDYSGPAPVALLPLDVAFEATLATGTPPPPAAGVRLVLPGGSAAAPLAPDAPSLVALWRDWPRIRAALRRRPGGAGRAAGEWPEAAPGGVAEPAKAGGKGGKQQAAGRKKKK